MDKLYTRAALIAARVNWKKGGKRVVFTNGCYDLLHPGHIRLLETARSLGASVGRCLREVHLPLMQRGLLAAMALVFLDVMKEMPATLLLRPVGLNTLAIAVWQRTAESLWQDAALPALAIVLAGLAPVALVLRVTGRGAAAWGLDAGESR